ncbi:MAG: hypothetical protein Q4B81_06155 [Moraxella sp.]|nr:hypothetical protein [Moraxella sp.]
MLESSVFLLDLATVKQQGGTYYIEIQKSQYAGKLPFWSESSIYIDGDIWLKFFEFSADDIIPEYDFYDFNSLSFEVCKKFANHLLELSDKVKQCHSADDFLKPELLSKSGKPYIQLNEGMAGLFFGEQEVEKRFDENFQKHAELLSREYQILAHWLIENGKNGVSILGI